MTDFFLYATGAFAAFVAVRMLTLHRARRSDDGRDTEV